jgi:hypothetical protein
MEKCYILTYVDPPTQTTGKVTVWTAEEATIEFAELDAQGCVVQLETKLVKA